MKIYDKSSNLLAIVIKPDDIVNEKNFVTDNSQEFQLASFNLKEGTIIENHHHPKQKREIHSTSEVITVIQGKLTVKLFDNSLMFVQSVTIQAGETIALFEGGHGIEVIEGCKFIESKQGPYIESIDKIRF
jgi:hypothetical protein